MNSNNGNLPLDNSELSSRLIALRQQQNLTKADLAAKANLSYRTVHDIEEGHRKNVQEKTLVALAHALGVPLESLFHTSDTKGTSRKTHLKRQPIYFLVAMAVILFSFAALKYVSINNATWKITGKELTAHDSIVGKTIWSYTARDRIMFANSAPWSSQELVLGTHKDSGQQGKVICLERGSGKVRWVQSVDLESMIRAFGEDVVMYAPFSATRPFEVDLNGDGTKELAVRFCHGSWYPYGIGVFDGQGNNVHQYNSYGHLMDIKCFDIDNDGKQEIIATGVNNSKSYLGAQIFILDEDHFSGASVDSFANPNSLARDNSLYRVVLPMFSPDYQKLMRDIRLCGMELNFVEDQEGDLIIRLTVGYPKNERFTVDFDNQLHPVGSEIGQMFMETMATWPDSLTRDAGPGDDAWRAEWLAGHYRFENGVMVHGDSLLARVSRSLER